MRSTWADIWPRWRRWRWSRSKWNWPTQLTPWIPSWPGLQREDLSHEKIERSCSAGVPPAVPRASRPRHCGLTRRMSKHLKETERLRKIVEAFPKVTVTVLGDLVADEFIFGEISRVSREAPVLILKHRERSIVPGGAANAVS